MREPRSGFSGVAVLSRLPGSEPFVGPVGPVGPLGPLGSVAVGSVGVSGFSLGVLTEPM